MIFRFVAPTLLMFAAPLLAQDVPPAAAVPVAPVKAAVVRVVMTTSLGPVVLELEKERAPVTTANFLRYVAAKRFDGINFYRAMSIGAGIGLVQGGVRDPRLIYPPIAHEPTSRTGLRHVDGTISMARGALGSATTDFFITVGAIPSLDADPQAPGDGQGFAAFGHVVEGMDVVHAILAAPTSPTEGEGVLKGQMLAPPVRIVTTRVVGP